MEHKGFAFDWSRFEADLYPLLLDAMTTNESAPLEKYIDQHLAELRDPYEGAPLPADWRDLLSNNDVHELADFALTRFYDPNACQGIGYAWAELSDQLPDSAAKAMLGFPIGPAENPFDPGRCGSYFRTPEQVEDAVSALQPHNCEALTPYLELLQRSAAKGLGVYVTF